MEYMYDLSQEARKEKDGVTYGEYRLIEYPSDVTDTNRKANVLLPPNYDEQKQYPILYLLHGIGGDEEEWFLSNPREILGNLMAEGKIPEMIAVLPNVRARKEDKGNPEDIYTKPHFDAFDKFILDLERNLMPYMKEHFSVMDGRENTAIGGYSMGGRETLYIGFSRPQLFGYIGAFSPAFGILPYGNNGVVEEGLIAEDEFKLPEQYPAFVMVMNGDHDLVVRDEPTRYHNALVNTKTEHVFYEVAGGGHDHEVWSNGLYNYVINLFPHLK